MSEITRELAEQYLKSVNEASGTMPTHFWHPDLGWIDIEDLTVEQAKLLFEELP